MNSFFANRSYQSPGIVPWVFIVLSIILLSSLGFWQLERLVWKENLLSKLEAGQVLVPITQLPADPAQLEDLLYRRVKLTGDLMRQVYFLRIGIHRDSGNGYYVLSPLSIGDTPHQLLVNRGFVAGDKAEVDTALAAEQATNPTVIEGILRAPYPSRMFTPKNHIDINMWSAEDISAMQQAANTGANGQTLSQPLHLLPYVVELRNELPQKGEVIPTPNTREIRFRNDHLVYAVTWFSLALTAVIMFFFYCWRRKPDNIQKRD